MKKQHYSNSAARCRLQTRASLAAILLLATPLLVWGQVTFTKITTGPLVTDVGNSWAANWADYDNDAYPDVLVGRWRVGQTALYRNNGDGTFTGVTNSLFPMTSEVDVLGGAWADFNNDGRVDLCPLYMPPPLTVYMNNGDGTFSPLSSGPFWDPPWYWHFSAVDYDQDGSIDLYFTTGTAESTNQLYRNLGDGTFRVMTAAEVGPIAEVTTMGGATWGDYDDDGWVDVCIGGGGGGQCLLFHNNGAGGFVSVNNQVTQATGWYPTATWGDYDNDGRLDLWATSWNGASHLYRNLGNGQFEIAAAGIVVTGVYVSGSFADYDNDGFLDLFVARYDGRNRLFHNNGNGTFTEITTGIIPTDQKVSGAGSYKGSWFDYDNDGFLDLFVTNGNEEGNARALNFLYHNEGNTNTWLRVKPVGTLSNRDGAGAKVRAKATFAGQTRWQRRDITAGDVFNGNNFIAHFGLGDATNVETLRVEWPSGQVTELTNVAANQFLTIRERGVILDPRTVVTAPTSNVTLRATVVGLTSPSLQWKLNGTNLPGAVSDTLVLSNIQVSDAGTYTVEATDDTGTYLSNPCQVTVYDKPVITQQPQSLTVTNDNRATFTVSAVSATPIRYQWRFNTATLADRTNATLSLTNVQAQNEGLYDVVVSDDHGSTNSDPAQLTVLLKPRITLCATNYTVVQGGNLTLSVEADGEQPIAYIWRRITGVKSRQTNYSHRSFFTLTNVQPAEDKTNGVYYLVNLLNSVLGGTGVQSDRIYLTVLPDSDGDGMDDAWETEHGLNPADPSDAILDGDSDGLSNRCECQCGTNPTNALSYLKVERIAVTGEAGIEFIAVANRTYTVEYSEDLDSAVWHTLADVAAGPDRTVVLTDPAASGHRYYRLVTPRQP